LTYGVTLLRCTVKKRAVIAHDSNPAKPPCDQWRFNDGDEAVQRELAHEFGIHPVVSQILMSRDLFDVDQARRFLKPSLNDLPSPFLMKDMEKGVRRVIQAVYRKEKITIYGITTPTA
jgi:single-stranded-DNA-specific exonuclease